MLKWQGAGVGPEFVDRDESLRLLGESVARLVAGRAGVVVVEAASGMGKSTLLREFARRLSGEAGVPGQDRRSESDGAPCRVVLVGATPGIGPRRAFGPVRDALDALRPAAAEQGRFLPRLGRTVRRGAVAAAPDLLSMAVPGLSAVFSAGRMFAEAAVATGSIPGDSLQPVASTVTRQLVEVVLTHARDGKPLLLMIDDIQLCDDSTLEFLHLLLPHLRHEPIGLVLGLGSYTARIGNGQAARELLDSWERDHSDLLTRHQLPPLPPWAVGRLVDVWLGEHALPVGFALELNEVTNGSPVFVEQCLRLWRPDHGSRVPLPRELDAAVRDRFERLDDVERELLCVGATMGEFFFSHTLAEVTGLAHARTQDLLYRIEQHHGLVRARPFDDVPAWAQGLDTSWYDFEHRVLQTGIRHAQDDGVRRRRHAAVASALEHMPVSGEGRRPLELRAVVADQYRLAGPAHAARSAGAHYDLARSIAVEDLSFAESEQYCRTAIDSARMLPDSHPERDVRLVEAIELLLSLTEVRWKGGEGEPESAGTDALAAEAEEAALRLGDPLLVARTTLMRGKTLLAVSGVEPSLEKLREAVDRARACGEQGRPVLFVAMVEYGRQLPKRDLRAGLRVLREAEELYACDPRLGETGNPVLQHARNLNEMQIGVNLFDAGLLGEARERLERCVRRLKSEPLHAELPIGLNYLAQLYLTTGEWDRAHSVLREALDFEERRGGDSGWHAYNTALLARVVARDPARADEAVQLAEDAWLETQRTWLVNLVPIVRNLYIETLLDTRGDVQLAARLAGDTLVDTRMSGMVRSEIAGYVLRGRIRTGQGQKDLASRDARQALALLAEHGDMPALRTEEVLYWAAETLAGAGDTDEAELLLNRARTVVLRKAGSIDDPARRERFLQQVPLNRRLFEDGEAG
ncbi:AAA family ATPase [Streptomyces anthocyanicus]|uniref:AAA family ATPase n=1 Tax=Streptomyces anthocyanicus TaxID=68174 RepID=UPI00386C5B6D